MLEPRQSEAAQGNGSLRYLFEEYALDTDRRRWSKDANSEALQLFYRAIELDPRLACAYGMAAYCYVRRKALGWMSERVQESAEAVRMARKAVHLGGVTQ